MDPKQVQPMPEAVPAPDAAPAPAPEQLDLAQVKSMLDLPQTATDLELITVLVNLVADLQNKYEGLRADAVAMEDTLTNRDLADYSHIISEEHLPFWKEQILKNRNIALEALNAIAERIAKPAETPALPVEEPRVIPLRNRLAEIERTVEKVSTEQPQETTPDPVAFRIRNRAHEIARSDNVPFIIAFNRAEREFSKEKVS